MGLRTQAAVLHLRHGRPLDRLERPPADSRPELAESGQGLLGLGEFGRRSACRCGSPGLWPVSISSRLETPSPSLSSPEDGVEAGR